MLIQPGSESHGASKRRLLEKVRDCGGARDRADGREPAHQGKVDAEPKVGNNASEITRNDLAICVSILPSHSVCALSSPVPLLCPFHCLLSPHHALAPIRRSRRYLPGLQDVGRYVHKIPYMPLLPTKCLPFPTSA